MSTGEPAKVDWESLSREALVAKGRALEERLAGVLAAHSAADADVRGPGKQGKKRKKQRAFDFGKWHERHVALKVAYQGERYHGLASQDTTDETIEAHLFAALRKSRLIESRETAKYSRCGRTDKGVSAFSQVLSLKLRTNKCGGVGFVHKESAVEHHGKRVPDETVAEELPYLAMLNRILPMDIRVLGWTPVPPHFNARFSCLSRTYKYYFLRSDLDLGAMQRAADLLCGSHDYRNFCKADVAGGVTNYRRRILSFTVRPTSLPGFGVVHSDGTRDQREEMCEFTITGLAFLWHQVRCMVAVLFMVGKGHEQPEIVARLLDIEATPCKPQYAMASELPLVLHDCRYEDLSWHHEPQAIAHLSKDVGKAHAQASIRSALWSNLFHSVNGSLFAQPEAAGGATMVSFDTLRSAGILQGVTPPAHKPLLNRPTADSIESRLATRAAKRAKLEEEQGQMEK